MKTDNKIIIAGPCSAESEEQLIQTARQIAALNMVQYLRAGIWKPRTNPGSFEGVGTIGLSWLLQAKKITGLKTATEVATAKHVEDALQFETDMLWIGARTTVNPFSVQEIANAVRGTNACVYIKNPVNPDLKLWIGAVERLQKAGITNIGLIHRGFSIYGNSEYRNVPMWQIPIEMRAAFPDYPMIGDPSHICGNVSGLRHIAQKCVNLTYDGLMLETHVNPAEAITDRQQQITPVELKLLLQELVWKSSSSSSPDYIQELEGLRAQINHCDEELVSLIGARMRIAREIGTLKKKHDITILQPARFNEVVSQYNQRAMKAGLSTEFILTYLSSIHMESIRIQNEKA